MNKGLKRRQVNRTASYTIAPDRDHPDTLFTNYGASGGITFTLPTPNVRLQGCRYEFLSVTNDDVTVAAPTADTLISLNDAAADSVAASTSSQKIGSHLVATCLETVTGTFQWLVTQHSNGVTATVAT